MSRKVVCCPQHIICLILQNIYLKFFTFVVLFPIQFLFLNCVFLYRLVERKRSSYWKETYSSQILWRRILQMKTRKFTITIRSLCVFSPRRNMKPLLGVSLRSENFGGEFKSFRCYFLHPPPQFSIIKHLCSFILCT
jgi:hypothetical protein